MSSGVDGLSTNKQDKSCKTFLKQCSPYMTCKIDIFHRCLTWIGVLASGKRHHVAVRRLLSQWLSQKWPQTNLVTVVVCAGPVCMTFKGRGLHKIIMVGMKRYSEYSNSDNTFKNVMSFYLCSNGSQRFNNKRLG